MEEIKNVQFIEFDTQESMFKYWNEKESQLVVNLIDWSLEHEKPCILELV